MGHAGHVLALVAAGAAGWVALRSGRRLLHALAALRALRRGRSWAVEDLPLGCYVGLQGQAVAIDCLESPHTGRRAVYLRRVEEVWDNTPNVVGAAGKWVCAAQEEEAAPFELTDGEQTVPVDPSGAEVLARTSTGRGEGLRFAEALLEPGERLAVLGHLVEQGGFVPREGYRGTAVRRVLGQGKRGLLIAPPALLHRRLGLRLGLGGAGLLAAGAFLVLLLLGALNGHGPCW